MPKVVVEKKNANFPDLASGQKKKVTEQVIDAIVRVSDLMRDKNNIIIGTHYRLDSKPAASAQNGHEKGDYKVDIQTVTAQKAQSVTVAIVYISPKAPETSLQDLKDAFTTCLTSKDIYRIT